MIDLDPWWRSIRNCQESRATEARELDGAVPG